MLLATGLSKRKSSSEKAVLEVRSLRDRRANGLETCQDHMLIRVKCDRVGARW